MERKDRELSCAATLCPSFMTLGLGKIRAVASYTGAELNLPAYEHFVDNKKPEFLAKFPMGKIPAFEAPNGLKLTEGVTIARFGENDNTIEHANIVMCLLVSQSLRAHPRAGFLG